VCHAGARGEGAAAFSYSIHGRKAGCVLHSGGSLSLYLRRQYAGSR